MTTFGKRTTPPVESRIDAEQRLIAELAAARAKNDTAAITQITNALNKLFA